MAQKGVAVVVGRAVVDEHYRRLLKDDPHSAFDGYELTGEEMQALKGIDLNTLDKLAASISDRMKHWFVGWAVNQ